MNISASFELLCLASAWKRLRDDGTRCASDLWSTPRTSPFRGAPLNRQDRFHALSDRATSFAALGRAGSAELGVSCRLARSAMNQMLINVAHVVCPSVRCPRDVPAPVGCLSIAASRRFVALSRTPEEWMASDLSGLVCW